MAMPYSKTKDGFESQFGTNHLAHLLLFQLVKSVLLSSATPSYPSRLVSVSSVGHIFSRPNFGDYNYGVQRMGLTTSSNLGAHLPRICLRYSWIPRCSARRRARSRAPLRRFGLRWAESGKVKEVGICLAWLRR
ncbi:uncharacterized protein EKO05_0003423 [Ascochyta rabiei]|uniref:uncharacterized protein n=1 Tax=Didymella rabiei TaxID=5454 RepID=UPI0021FCFBE2|nr:uncharacterized protein EKO05_0003423 [Ascochyta rabiei]UPX12890.1 hypothetical protein EKO05_0003423 [Ascochyta rabiei]